MLNRPLHSVLKLSASQQAMLNAAGFITCRDLLFRAPVRYENHSHCTPISDFVEGESFCVEATVLQQEALPFARKMLRVGIVDEEGHLAQLVFFHHYPSLRQALRQGRRGRFYGKVQRFRGLWNLHHPQITWLDEKQALPTHQQACYRGRPADALRRRWLKRLLEALPEQDFLHFPDLPSFAQALRILHQPPLEHSEALLARAWQRLCLEELLAQQVALKRLREASDWAPPLPIEEALLGRAIAALPFSLTAAQSRAQAEIRADLEQKRAMWRLLQGDVGSGKTVLAWLAAYQTAQAGKQALLLAPTELLVQQHFASFQRFNHADLNVVMLTAQDKSALPAIADGSAQIIVATHAALQKNVMYHDLALQIIDEQHRFGVAQRLRLQEKRGLHTLLMSATPIPRTLALTQYGDLNVSRLDERPRGRLPIITKIYPSTRRAEIMARVGHLCRQGQQAFWVAPAIDEDSDLENVTVLAQSLQEALPDLNIALLHGKLSASARQKVMADCVAGKIDVLVATTVIEVGVDVPQANVMVIEQAERFGLSQLHQLRGRVGRGQNQGYCLLLYQQLSDIAAQRLEALRQHEDGFQLAEMDWQLRGSGTLLGMQQAGGDDLYFAALPRDEALLQRAKAYAQTGSFAAEALLERWFAPENSSQELVAAGKN